MPKYKIQLKQGKRTVVAHGEFKSVASVLAHYNHISTMQVTEILRIEYEDESQPPIDDFNYRSLFKGILKNDATRKSKQVIFNNIKLTINEREIIDSCKVHMEIDNSVVDSAISTLFKT
ncbi:MAG: hypothetical protein Q7S59_05870 [Sulfurimonas sp.]|nr:hypothetical protein [Sulfurimonas sp.]